MRFLKIEFIAIVLGIMVGVGLPALSTAFDSWEFVGRVPEPPTVILSAFPIYVQTSDDRIYVCGRLNSKVSSCWEYQEHTAPSYPSSCGTPNSQTPLYPGHVVASLSVNICFAEWSTNYYTIALDDGTVWTWSSGGYFGSIGNFFFLIATCFVGAMLGIPVYLVVWWRSRRRDDKAKRF